jgi:hypothetical protein
VAPDEEHAWDYLSAIFDQESSPRVGLRRWVMMKAAPPATTISRFQGIHLELLHDGSVVLAAQSFEATEDALVLQSRALAGHIAALVSLISAVSESRGIASAWTLRLDLHHDLARPHVLHVPNWRGNRVATINQPWTARPVHDFQPVEALIPPLLDDAARQATVDSLLTDSASQFGVTPDQMRPPPQER